MAGATTREIMEATVRKTMSQAASYKQFLYKSFIFLVPGGGRTKLQYKPAPEPAPKKP
jgi:hypothetical protein